jgi:formyltetrahydrofolate deformylase
MLADPEFVLTFSCHEARGIVHAVSDRLGQAGCTVIDAQPYADLADRPVAGLFFMRRPVEHRVRQGRHRQAVFY